MKQLRGLRSVLVIGLAGVAVVAMGVAVPGAAQAAAATYRTTADVGERLAPVAVPNGRYGVPAGTAISVECQVIGEPTGPRSNTLFFKTFYAGRYLYVPDAWTDSPHLAGQPPIAGIPMCGETRGPTYVNGVNVGFPQNAQHSWGRCTVTDYNGGPQGWVIVSVTNGQHLVRNGMLWGWVDNGGGPGALGCPTTDEYGYGGGARQDFTGGSLVWTPGMDHARRLTASSTPSGPGAFQNLAIATWMLGYAPGGVRGGLSPVEKGSGLGECRDAVNKAVAAVSGGRMTLGAISNAEKADYNAGFRRLGGYRVPSVDQAVGGDIVQIGNGVHTYVIVRNRGGGQLEVVDSNHLHGDGRVMHYIRAFNSNGYAAQSTIWRLGRV